MRCLLKLVLLPCMAIWIGYEASAHQNTPSPQIDIQDALNRLYGDTSSFINKVNKVNKVSRVDKLGSSQLNQCQTHIIDRVELTDFFRVYCVMVLVEHVRSIDRFGNFYAPTLSQALGYKNRIIRDMSLEDIDFMRQELRELETQWDLCGDTPAPYRHWGTGRLDCTL